MCTYRANGGGLWMSNNIRYLFPASERVGEFECAWIFLVSARFICTRKKAIQIWSVKLSFGIEEYDHADS